MMYYRRLPLEGLLNARDLGGFPVKNGSATKFGVFVRSEIPRNLSDSDILFLKNYGVTADMDFRGDNECELLPNSLRTQDFIEYIRMPVFFGQMAPMEHQDKKAVENFTSWGDFYVGTCELCKEWVRDIFTKAALCSGCMLYNCTTGKDRTGVMTALLLSAVGVSREDIIADYCASMIHMKSVYPTLSFTIEMEKRFYITPPEAMEQLLSHWDDKYGGVLNYLSSCGVEQSAVDALVRKFVVTE